MTAKEIEQIRAKLVRVIIDHDLKEQAKADKAAAAGKHGKGHNRNFLGIALISLDENTIDCLQAGQTIRKAILAGFNGSLADKMLKIFGEAKATREEKYF